MSMESLINLDSLTEDERKIILSVLRKDDELKKTQDRKIGQLKLEIQAIRMKSVLRSGDDLSKICARCHSELGFLFNRGDLCPKCHFRVCRACQDQVLGGTWLCSLCHKQRQLRFFMEEWNSKGKKKKTTGTELVKASMMKKRRTGRVNDENQDVEKSRVQNGNPVQNGTAFRSKKEAENERIEYPSDSDKRKLSNLLDSFKLSRGSDKSDDDIKHPVAVKKLSTKRYDDSDDSSSSDSEGTNDVVSKNILPTVGDIQNSDNVGNVSVNTSRGILQRNYSDDSDQTAISDETPFLKNAGSTETQIRVDIHSDSSGSPQKIKTGLSDKVPTEKIKTPKSNNVHYQIDRTESLSSYRSTSPEIIDTPSMQKRQIYWQNRSPSPYSFDSIPSSHADSPLPKKRMSTELYHNDSDSESRTSAVSGGGEHSGTESAVKDSGGEEFTVEEFSKIRFRRVSTKKPPKSFGSPESSPIKDQEDHHRGFSGKGRVPIDLPMEKGFVQVSEISLGDIEQDAENDESFVNVDLIPTFTSSEPHMHGAGLVLSDSKGQSSARKETSRRNEKSKRGSARVSDIDIKRDAKDLKDDVGTEETRKSVQMLKKEWEMNLSPKRTRFVREMDSPTSPTMKVKQFDQGMKPTKTTSQEVKEVHVTKLIKMEDEHKHAVKNSDNSFEEMLKAVKQVDSLEQKPKEKSKRQKSSQDVDAEFDDIFNMAVADLSVDESTTDMSDTGSLTRAKGKKLKKLLKKRKVGKRDQKLSESEIDENMEEARGYDRDKISGVSEVSEIVDTVSKPEEKVTEEEIEVQNNKFVGQSLPAIVEKVNIKAKQIETETQAIEEDTISPVLVKREEVSKIDFDNLENMKKKESLENMMKKEKTADQKQTADTDKLQMESGQPSAVQLYAESTSKIDTEKEAAIEIQEKIQSGELDFENLTLGEVRILMKNNILPMDDELLKLIDEHFTQTQLPENRFETIQRQILGMSTDSDELSVIHEESEPSDSDTSADQLKGQGQSENEADTNGSKVNLIIPEIKIVDYEDDDESQEKEDILEDQNGEMESDEKYGSSEVTQKSKNQDSSLEELQQFYKDVKEQVALEDTTDEMTSQDRSPSDNVEKRQDEIDIKYQKVSQNIKQFVDKLDTSQMQDKDQSVSPDIDSTATDENTISRTNLSNTDTDSLITLVHHGKSSGIDIQRLVVKEIPEEQTLIDERSVNEQQFESRRTLITEKQFSPKASSVTLELEDLDSKSSNENKLAMKNVNINEIEIASSLTEGLEMENLETTQFEIYGTPKADIPKFGIETPQFERYETPKANTPKAIHLADNTFIGQSDLSADITLTPTEQSIDSEMTFCTALEDNTLVKGKGQSSKCNKYDIVGQSLSREVLVKQWLVSKTREDNDSPQSDMSDATSEKFSLKINPALLSDAPACELPGDSGALPKLNMQDWKETETDSITKLSPRASSEGSASFEDSGHVSGASTQENTPEHRRTDSLQSQTSMGSSKLSTVTDKESEEDLDIDELVRSHKSSTHSSLGGSRGNLLSAFTESKESIVSFYSNAGDVDYNKIPITGDIEFGLDYNYRTGTLEIHIVKCKGLAPADTKRNRSDPYVKTYLLPDKTRSGKRKTKIKKHTLNPVFDEKLRYLISKSELENRTVWITVWHNDRFGRNDFLGEVTINFDYYRFGDSAPKWYKLQERFEQPQSLAAYQGDIILCLKYVPPEKVNHDVETPSPSRKRFKKPKSPGDKGQLQVMIKEARNLTAVRSNGFSDPFCKGQLQPDKEKQKTHVIKKECNPVWNSTMIFDDVTVDSLREKSLELTIWDYDKLSSNDFLGGVRLNLGLGKSCGKNVEWMDARGEEISLWQAMLDRPNFWIDGALVLRSTMNKRK